MPTWHTGAAWRVVNSLNKLNEQIRAYAPRALPPATSADAWGSIADNAHSTSSDHYPHYYAALGSTAVVCARDFPHAPGLGLDGGVVTEHLRQSRDPRLQYVIFNRRITGRNYANEDGEWIWHNYTGDDPHNTHFHVSGVHGTVADSVAAWSLPGGVSAASIPEGSDMPIVVKFSDNAATFLSDGITSRWLPDGASVGFILALAKNGWFDLGNVKKDPVNPQVCVLGPEQKGGVLGRIVGPVPAGYEAYADDPLDPATFAAAVVAALPAGSTDGAVVEAAVLRVLQSIAGQAALVQAANTAEDS
jgi:hypothetical protein